MEHLNTLQQQFDEMHHSTEVALAKVEILAQNHGLLLSARTIMRQVLGFHCHALGKFSEYRLLCIDTQMVRLLIQAPEQREKYKEACQKQVDFFREFKTEQVTMYKAVLPEVGKHRQQVSTHLIAIAENS